MIKDSKVVVTGSAGFIGSALVRRLLSLGYSVLGIDNHNDYYNPRIKDLRVDHFKHHDNYEHLRISIEEREKLFKVLGSYSPDIIVHLAAQAGVRYSLDSPNTYVQSNLVGFSNILEACNRYDTKHLIYASSSSVYGASSKLPFSVRDSSDHPVSLYGATKKANETLAHSYSHIHNLPTTGLRFFTVYGPWGRPDMALYKFTHSILNGLPIKIYNEGNHMRDFTYIDDIIDGLLLVIQKGPQKSDQLWNSQEPNNNSSEAPWRIFNLGNGNPTKLTKFIELIEENLGVQAKKEFLPMQPGDVVETSADITDTKEFYGFMPKTDVEDGIKSFIEWFLEFRHKIE